MANKTNRRSSKGRKTIIERDADPTAADSYKAHLRAISTLLLDTMHHVNVLQEEACGREFSEADLKDMERAREFTVEAAWALGAITSKEAKAKHGVSI
jgi:hypothetical protein